MSRGMGKGVKAAITLTSACHPPLLACLLRRGHILLESDPDMHALIEKKMDYRSRNVIKLEVR